MFLKEGGKANRKYFLTSAFHFLSYKLLFLSDTAGVLVCGQGIAFYNIL
jgi:hypothetical protein